MNLKILILHSEDGIGYTHAVLYPAEWPEERADALAVAAFIAAQKVDPEEWSWEDMEPELTERGFILVDWHNGPNWDEQRVPSNGSDDL